MAQVTDTYIDLREHSDALQRMLHDGIPDSDTDQWIAELEARLREVSSAIMAIAHRVDGGLYDDVITTAPRMAPKIRQLLAEQDALFHDVTEHLTALEDRSSIDDRWETMRNSMATVCRRARVHSHRSVDVVFNAYDIDLGGPG